MSMSRVRVLKSDAEFQAEMNGSGMKLVIVDYTASWCGPCQRIAPVFDSYSNKYPLAIFLKIDVDKCHETAMSQSISAMPTFILYKNKVKLERIQGADAIALEAKIKKYYDPVDGEPCEVSGHMDLASFILKDECTILNVVDDSPATNVMYEDEKFVLSDCDEEILFSFSFSQQVKIHSIKIKCNEGDGPKKIGLFVNQPCMDFDSAHGLQPQQEFELSPEDLTGKAVNLRYVKFQNIRNIDVLVLNNQKSSESTRVDLISFIGTPINATNMQDFKRVAGKKGESH